MVDFVLGLGHGVRVWGLCVRCLEVRCKVFLHCIWKAYAEIAKCCGWRLFDMVIVAVSNGLAFAEIQFETSYLLWWLGSGEEGFRIPGLRQEWGDGIWREQTGDLVSEQLESRSSSHAPSPRDSRQLQMLTLRDLCRSLPGRSIRDGAESRHWIGYRAGFRVYGLGFLCPGVPFGLLKVWNC